MNTFVNTSVNTSSSLAIIDFAPFLHGTTADRQAVAKRINQASREIGFFYLHNHGIASALIAQTFEQAKRFFAQSLAQKQQIAIEKSSCHRGYFSFGGENLDPITQGEQGDFKEGLKIGRDLAPDHPLVLAGTPLHGPNQWPSDLPAWRETMQAYYDACKTLGYALMQAFALALNLPEDYFHDCLQGPMATLGPLHYPPPNPSQNSPRKTISLSAGAHTDYGCLTLLAQDENRGLQVRAKNSSSDQAHWLDVAPIENTLVVNIGDMLARWSNDLYSSTRHRVINQSGRDRYSLAFFYDPAFDTDISCLPSCCSLENPCRYQATTGGEYLLSRIDEAFSYHRDAQNQISSRSQ